MNKRNTPKNTINLPSNYQFKKVIDLQQNKKAFYGMQISIVAVIGLMIGLSILLDFPMKSSWSTIGTILITVVMAVAYLILHEFTHGTAMYLLSGVKPFYGMKLPFLYTASPVYFNKGSFILMVLAPVVAWGIILTTLLFVLPQDFFKSIYIVLAINFAGASGDLFLTYEVLKMPYDGLFQDNDGVVAKFFLPVE